MTLAELIAAREPDWRALEERIALRKKVFHSRKPEDVARFTSLYRAACSDLALAESYQFPPHIVSYLHNLVGRAHNCLYNVKGARSGRWRRAFLYDAPRWIVSDPIFWVALALFWIPFLVCEYKSRVDPSFAISVCGSQLTELESMYDDSLDFQHTEYLDRIPYVAFYAYNNGGIGLKCFALGAVGCLPGLFILLSNSIVLGCSFGYMQSVDVSSAATTNFLEFTTAHGPFELTAIVLAAASGLRIGYGAIMTGGHARYDSIRRSAIRAFPCVVLSFILFCAAATIESFVSPIEHNWAESISLSSIAIKRIVAYLSTAILFFYFGVLGLGALVKNRFFSKR